MKNLYGKYMDKINNGAMPILEYVNPLSRLGKKIK